MCLRYAVFASRVSGAAFRSDSVSSTWLCLLHTEFQHLLLSGSAPDVISQPARQIEMQPLLPGWRNAFPWDSCLLVKFLFYLPDAVVVLQVSPTKRSLENNSPKMCIFVSFVSPLQTETNTVSSKRNEWLFRVSSSLLCAVVLRI